MKRKYYSTNHLTIYEREFIEKCLSNYDSKTLNFRIIADSINKDASTISKEIRKHRFKHEASRFTNTNANLCINRFTCTKTNVCKTNCKHKCKECEYCNSFCSSFVKAECSKLTKPPYVCNGCKTSGKCMYEKFYYRADKAQKEYQELLSGSRCGLNMTWSEFKTYEKEIKKGVSKGQSIYHIKQSNPDIPFEVPTIYQHIEKGIIDVKNIDLIRKVKLKPKKQTILEKKKIAARKIGKSYEDFLNFISEHPFIPVIEMDTVIGKRDEDPVLLTFLHRDSNLFWSYIIPSKTSGCVANKINEFYETIGFDLFQEFCPVILTDNGTEFENPEEIEFTLDGKRRCFVFYCRPMHSGDKGKLEQTHTLVRRVLPKKTSFKDLSQEQVDLINNHINNYARRELNGCTPFQLAKVVIKKKILDVLNLHEISPQEVTLKPSLLK